jgi:hypothetical protein
MAKGRQRGSAYPVKPKWQADVKARLVELGMTEKQLAAAVKCAQSTMHATLNSADARHSSLVPKIHAVLKWPAPVDPNSAPLILSPDALEVATMFDQLPEEAKRSMRDQVATILGLLNKSGS